MSKNNINLDLLRIGSTTFFLRMLGVIALYLFTFFVAKLYGAETMGRLAIAMTIILLGSIIARLGLDTSLLKLISSSTTTENTKKARGYYIKSSAAASVTACFISALLFLYATEVSTIIFSNQNLSHYIKISAVTILPFTLLSLNYESLRARKKINSYSFLYYNGLSIFLFSNLFLLLLTALNSNKQNPIIAYALAIITSSIISIFLIKKVLFKENHAFTAVPANKIFKISLPIMATSFIFYAMQWTDTLLLGIYRSETEVGIYNIAIRLAGIVSFALISINAYVAPRISELYAKGRTGELTKLIEFSSKVIFYLSFPVIFLFLLFPHEISGLFGEEFKAGGYALRILAIGQFINAVCGSVAHLLQMTGQEKIFRNIIVISFIINIFLNIVLIPQYGIDGAAIASVASICFWNILSAYFIYKKLNIISVYIPFMSLLFKKTLPLRPPP